MNRDKIMSAGIDWHHFVGQRITKNSMNAFIMGAELGHNHDCWQIYLDLPVERQKYIDRLKKKWSKK